VPSTLNVTIALSHGVATPVSGQIQDTPTGLYYDSDSIKYEICDNTTLLYSCAAVFVTVLPDGLIAVPDAYRIANGATLNADVLFPLVGFVTLTILSGPANGTTVVIVNKIIFYSSVPAFCEN
jgi:hypothetical protein